MISISQKEYLQLAEFIKKNYGINLGDKKQSLLMGRLQNVLVENGFTSFTQYYEYITSDKTGKAISTLINKVTTNHTFFMREPEHFAFFSEKILPYLKSTVKNNDLRIWSAGCSTGEEPYTIAMLIDQFFGREKSLWDTKVLATDISSKVLETAVKGQYGNESVETLPSSWLNSYFKKLSSGNYEVTASIKNEVLFRKLNLMQEIFPFKRKFHVIFCRNVMIYFDEETRYNLVNKFYELLEYGGYLLIGHSESLNRNNTRFKYIIPAVYRKE